MRQVVFSTHKNYSLNCRARSWSFLSKTPFHFKSLFRWYACTAISKYQLLPFLRCLTSDCKVAHLINLMRKASRIVLYLCGNTFLYPTPQNLTELPWLNLNRFWMKIWRLWASRVSPISFILLLWRAKSTRHWRKLFSIGFWTKTKFAFSHPILCWSCLKLSKDLIVMISNPSNWFRNKLLDSAECYHFRTWTNCSSFTVS